MYETQYSYFINPVTKKFLQTNEAHSPITTPPSFYFGDRPKFTLSFPANTLAEGDTLIAVLDNENRFLDTKQATGLNPVMAGVLHEVNSDEANAQSLEIQLFDYSKKFADVINGHDNAVTCLFTVYLKSTDGEGNFTFVELGQTIANGEPTVTSPECVWDDLPVTKYYTREELDAVYNQFLAGVSLVVEYSNLAKSYAVGGTGTRGGEDNDNAKHYCELAGNALVAVQELQRSVNTLAAQAHTDAANIEQYKNQIVAASQNVGSLAAQVSNDAQKVAADKRSVAQDRQSVEQMKQSVETTNGNVNEKAQEVAQNAQQVASDKTAAAGFASRAENAAERAEEAAAGIVPPLQLPSPPTTLTVGSVGQLAVWHDSDNDKDHLYHLCFVSEGESATLYHWEECVLVSQGNVAGGYPVLDENGKVASAQLPPISNAPEPIIGTTAPTTSTVGVVGQLYVNTVTSKTYHCTSIANAGTESEPVWSYTWTDDVNEKGGLVLGEVTVQYPTYSNYIKLQSGRLFVGKNHNLNSGSYGAVLIGSQNETFNGDCLLAGDALLCNRSSQSVFGSYNISDRNAYVIVGGGTSRSNRRNGLVLSDKGDLYIAGGHQQGTTEIPSATTSYMLAEGCQSHVPSEASVYTLPAIPVLIATDNCYFTRNPATDGTGYYGWLSRSTNRYTSSATPSVGDNTYTNTALTQGERPITAIDNRTHECILTIKFSATVLTYEFQDSAGNTLVPLPLNGDIEAGSVVTFLCRYNPLLSQWVIYPIMDGKEVTP